jgi:uncharacterized protein (DUF362 family)
VTLLLFTRNSVKEVPKVVVVRSEYENFRENLRAAIELSGGIELRDKQAVAVKINLCDCRPPETGAITHPVSLDCILGYVRQKLGSIPLYVVESDATVSRPDLLVKWFGFTRVLEKWGAEWRNLSKERILKKPIKGRRFRRVRVPTILNDSLVINLSKLKTHCITRISCSLKNQYGCIVYPWKVRFHEFLDDAIVDANMAMPADFSVVDGVIAMGGAQAPAYGIPLHKKLLVAGKDSVAVDYVSAQIMRFNPYLVGHLRKAWQSGIGSRKFQLLGEKMENVRSDFEFNTIDYLVLKAARIVRRWSQK